MEVHELFLEIREDPEVQKGMKKDGQFRTAVFFLWRRYFLFLMGCNKKLYNVLGGLR